MEGQTMKQNTQDQYPLYDIPWLVRDPNDYNMSLKRHKTELRNQTVVDDYFTFRAKGLNAHDAKKQAAEKHQITTKRLHYILVWFYREAKKRKKYDFLENFPLLVEHQSRFC